jgi:hypothetical protein
MEPPRYAVRRLKSSLMNDESFDRAGASDPTQEQAESAYEGRRAPSDEEAPSGTRTGRGAALPTGGGAGPGADDSESVLDGGRRNRAASNPKKSQRPERLSDE